MEDRRCGFCSGRRFPMRSLFGCTMSEVEIIEAMACEVAKMDVAITWQNNSDIAGPTFAWIFGYPLIP
jgi:hypothetical protein